MKQESIIDCYNKTAKNYAAKFAEELIHKHCDRMLLKTFAQENFRKGTILDIGCGPGQTTAFLNSQGISDLKGTDLSEGMVKTARMLFPHIVFEKANMLDLQYANESFGSAIAFYAIVHFNISEIEKAMTEIFRILKPGGDFLCSFHIGEGKIHFDNFLGHQVDIDFHFFNTGSVSTIAVKSGFEIVDVIEREPYINSEHPSRRAYLWLSRPEQ